MSKRQIPLVAGIIITPLLLWFLHLIWMSSYVTVPTTLLFPYASSEMLIEKRLGPPDTLGAPTLLGLLFACAQYPIYGWLIGKASPEDKVKAKITRIAAYHFGISAIVLVVYFAGHVESFGPLCCDGSER